MKNDSEPKIDESLLTEAQKKEMAKPILNWKWALLWGVLSLAMIICVIVVLVIR